VGKEKEILWYVRGLHVCITAFDVENKTWNLKRRKGKFFISEEGNGYYTNSLSMRHDDLYGISFNNGIIDRDENIFQNLHQLANKIG